MCNSKRFVNRRTKAGRSEPQTIVQNAVGTPVQKPENHRAFVGGPSYKSPSIDKEGKRKEEKRQERDDDDQPITAEMVAQGVKVELGLAGKDIMLCLTEICRPRLERGADPAKLRNGLVKAWSTYKAAKPRLTWSYGSAEKFYAGDTWDDPDLWPWKDGTAPAVAGSSPRGYDNVEDVIAKLGGPRAAS